MTPTKIDTRQNYPGLIILTHSVVDDASKLRASKSLDGWEQIIAPADEWIKALENGHTIQPSDFSPAPDGTFSHKKEYWQGTNFVCADGDNFQGVEKHTDGTEKNPDGLPYWTGQRVLGEKFPALKDKAYAVGQSVSSMSAEPKHRRYRLIFLFDKPIASPEHYSQILLKLAEEFPVIPSVERSPAQPVFGNARQGFNKFSVCGNILALDDFPFVPPAESTESLQETLPDSKPAQTLQEFLTSHNIPFTLSPDGSKLYVCCPRKESHTGGKQGKTDSYVWDDGKWSFYCSHASCANHRTWDAFRDGNGIPKKEYNGKPAKTAKPTQTDAPVVPVVETELPVFPDTDGEHFPGLFADLYHAYAHSHVMTAPAIMALGIAAVGHCAGRRVIVKTSDVTKESVFLNTYTLLIGRSDLTAKSDTREELNGILSHVYHGDFYPISDVQSIEGVIRSMETEETTWKDANEGGEFCQRKGYPEGSRMFVMLDEIATLFANARREGTKNLLSAINKFWKCPVTERVARASGEQMVEYPVLNVWGNITPNQVSEYLQGLDLTGGTINRFMPFFVQPKVETVRHPHAVVNYYDNVVKWLQYVADGSNQRTLIFTEEADDCRFEWFKAQRETQLEKDDDKGETRFHTTAVKIAGIFALASNDEHDNTVKKCHWDDALAVTRYLIESYNYSFRQVGISERAKIEGQILEVLNANGNEITLTELSRKTQSIDRTDRRDALESLQTDGLIQTVEESTGGRAKKMIRRVGD